MVDVGSQVKILYFSKGYTPHDHRFLSYLAETDYAVYFMQLEKLLFTRENRPLPEGITTVTWGGGGKPLRLTNLFKFKRDLERVLRDLRPDLVHAGPVQKGGFLTALTGFSPLITMSWGSDLLLDARMGLGRWIAKYTLGKTTVLLCDCDAVAEVAQELGMPRERIIQFPWGVDLDHFSPGSGKEIREALGWEDATILLSTRNWEPVYGVNLVCQAFIKIAQNDEKTHLLLLGDGSLRDPIERLLHRSGLEHRVHLAGFVSFDDLPKYYRAANLYISASHVDGSSVSLLEALACGIPALVSNIPGNREWVTPGVNGWWFQEGSAEALANVLLEAIQNIDQLRDYSEMSRQIAEERADWGKNSEGLHHAYKLALAIEREQS
ncbi:MAG: hypothetical protein A2Z14_04010 [Chloroflexi bacterium RBG_16_48_8]|nr:MAG: hypothetical protein A2Z14_04010 [Chloroflexi bacterium RBG_16_48_8]